MSELASEFNDTYSDARWCSVSLPERVKKIRAHFGYSQKAMAESMGINTRTWQIWEEGGSVPGGNHLESLVRLGFNANWILTGEGPMLRGDSVAGDASATGGEYVHIPRFEVAASAGGGAVVHSEQIVDYLSFRADWVRSTLGVSVRDLALISVIGDSMEPSLSEGDVVLLDMTTRSVLDGSIYALQLNGGLLVKRIQRMLDGSLVVKPDNPRYDTEIISEDSADLLKIIGRVVWVGRRL